MRKILISLCLILVTTLSIACCKSEKINDDNLILISNIEIFDSPQEIVKCLSDMESELNNFISQNKGIKENSKVFGLYIKNATVQINKFMEITDFNQNGNFQTLDVDKRDNHFINPRVNNVFLSEVNGINLVFDYNYIMKNYGSYLDETWNTYIKYQIDFNKEFESFLYEDMTPETYQQFITANKEWIKKWTEFITLHKDFPLIEEINQQITELKTKLNE